MATKKADRPSDADMVDTIAEKGVEREKIAEIEGAIARADKKRKENAEIEDTLSTELKSREAKLNEVMHAHYDELEDEEDAKGNKLRVYRRGDFRAAITARETLTYEVAKTSQREAAAQRGDKE